MQYELSVERRSEAAILKDYNHLGPSTLVSTESANSFISEVHALFLLCRKGSP